jgi:hypothetical protein
MENESKTETRTKAAGILNYIFFVLNLTGLVLLPVVIVGTRDIFADTFEKYAVDVPAATEFMLSVPGSVYFFIFFLIAAVMITMEIFITKNRSKLLINILLSAAAGFVVLVYAVALIIPLIRCMQSSI